MPPPTAYLKTVMVVILFKNKIICNLFISEFFLFFLKPNNFLFLFLEQNKLHFLSKFRWIWEWPTATTFSIFSVVCGATIWKCRLRTQSSAGISLLHFSPTLPKQGRDIKNDLEKETQKCYFKTGEYQMHRDHLS